MTLVDDLTFDGQSTMASCEHADREVMVHTGSNETGGVLATVLLVQSNEELK